VTALPDIVSLCVFSAARWKQVWTNPFSTMKLKPMVEKQGREFACSPNHFISYSIMSLYIYTDLVHCGLNCYEDTKPDII
jgi:hypothetical protein